MIKYYLWLGIATLTFGVTSCTLKSKFSKSDDYQGSSRLSELHLVVVGDESTKKAMSYVNDFLTDSLAKKNIKLTKTYHCCRDKETDMSLLFPKLLPTDYRPEHVLAVVIAKTVVGYGATSSREIDIHLFNTSLQKRTWGGRVEVHMSWFVSDDDYRKVAKSLTKTIMAELKKKGIVSTSD